MQLKKLVLTVLFIVLAITAPGVTAYADDENEGSPLAGVTADIQGRTTIMVYIIGTDLETNNALATKDLVKMCDSGIGSSDKVSVVVQTGGAKSWRKDLGDPGNKLGVTISNTDVQRYRVVETGLQALGNVGSVSMAKSKTLCDFIVWGEQNYRASRYILVLWGHGGACNWGIGADQNFAADADLGAMSLNTITDALSQARSLTGTKPDIIGFDTCLNANLEVASALRDEADYLVASADYETGYAWDEWLKRLKDRPEAGSAEVCGDIAQTYMDDKVKELEQIASESGVASAFLNPYTMSVINLGKIPDLNSGVLNMAGKMQAMLGDDTSFLQLLKARDSAESYGTTNGSDDSDLVDLFFLASNLDEQSAESINGLMYEAVPHSDAYNRANGGLSLYFPLRADDKTLDANAKIYQDIKYPASWQGYISFSEEFAKRLKQKRSDGIKLAVNDGQTVKVAEDDLLWVKEAQLVLNKDGALYLANNGAGFDAASGSLSLKNALTYYSINGFNVVMPAIYSINRTTDVTVYNIPVLVSIDGKMVDGSVRVIVSPEAPAGIATGLVYQFNDNPPASYDFSSFGPCEVAFLQESSGGKLVESGRSTVAKLTDLRFDSATRLPAGSYQAWYRIVSWAGSASFSYMLEKPYIVK